ncbi:uncharacterized protein JN550_009178 [Neoarthrinium moseri]|uniref:uncharacterized protein n=1 Tax=Neoarthrinium moseri TaxID=1658444 RepID=UPI001FDB7E89|nr:uncharacterized protein JN550_009178 [Neoarthrinium moseri]KAI1863899.1 hypothetical protein JN550_009178 [Neoarthrinium moseri]
MMAHEQLSPATSSATNRTNRGGRPKEWTDPRTRRLTRLYVYTALKVDKILEVLEDKAWSPGKEAANKHLNHLLGKDPRWMRPKDWGEARQRVAGLKGSERARPSPKCACPNQFSPHPMHAPQGDRFQDVSRSDTMDSAMLSRSSGSSMEKRDLFVLGTDSQGMHNGYAVPPQHGPAHDLGTMHNPSYTSLGRFMPKIRSRQGTQMTTSTNFSVGSSREAYRSLQEKLRGVNGIGRSDIKDVFRLLKRFTISNEPDAGHANYSPNESAMHPRASPNIDFAQYQEEGTTTPRIVQYPLPCDFIHTNAASHNPATGMDQFGNTIYHELAISAGCERQLIDLVSERSRAQDPTLNATNTGGQTFLHVLHDDWFSEPALLKDLVNTLRTTQFNFYAADVYGRSFFHLLRQKLADPGDMRDFTPYFDIKRYNTRDAFGVRPMIGRATTMTATRERPASLTIPTTDRNQERIEHHTALLKIVNGATQTLNGHATEDTQGRNALHCLAEVILGYATIQDPTNSTRAPKRKLDVTDEPVSLHCPLSQRLEFLETVLVANVDVNHYNARGDTVLMSFITHIADGKDDKDLEQLIKRLIQAGAKLEARNRSGETVLQVAARLGQKFAVKVLVEHGANLHVRNCDGRSILQMIDDLTRLSPEWSEQLARLEATRGVLTGRFSKFQAEQDPSLFQEWGLRSSFPMSA